MQTSAKNEFYEPSADETASPFIPASKQTENKGIIVESDSSIVIKDDEGNDLYLKILKNPIDISNIESDNEESDDIYSGNDTSKRSITLKRNMKNVEIKTISRYGSVLKKPLSLDDLQEGSENQKTISYRKTCRNVYSLRPKKVHQSSISVWKQNALTILEYTSVYPFIHAFNKYKCFVCAKEFLDPSRLREHSLLYHQFKDFERELNNRAREKNIKVDVNLLKCYICLAYSEDLQSLKNHLKGHGKNINTDIQDNIIPFKLGGSSFECQICRESFQKIRLLIIHMSKHFKNYSCEKCGTSFLSLHLLKRHLETHKIGSYPCERCDKIFNNSAKRTLHFRSVHLKHLLRICPICPERFNSNYQRTKHLRMIHNHNTELYKCETCGRQYGLKYQLLVHIRSVHMQERNHECNVCQARFFSKYCLSRHMVVHSDEKKFKCEVCGKCYARLRNLNDHFKTHDSTIKFCLSARHCIDETALAEHMNAHRVF